jgi:3-hydroxyisobutyrate dehydrogenase-like beta-hydroxyacid dehydrogenase
MTATTQRITVVGLGAMGGGMARALLAAGHSVTVHNRTPGKARPLAEAGATVADGYAAAAEKADVVLLSLADETAVEEVLFGALADHLRPGQLVVDTSTVSPEFARTAGSRMAQRGLCRVEACVIGNPAMAAAGQLRVYTAGDAAGVEAAGPVLNSLSQSVVHLGAAGRASSLKLAFNLLLGVQTAGLAEMVRLAEAAGLDRAQVLDAVEGSGWRSPVLTFRGRFMRDGSYAPAGFRSALMLKDLQLAQREAAAHGVALPVTTRVAERFTEVVEAGHGDEDAAVIVET